MITSERDTKQSLPTPPEERTRFDRFAEHSSGLVSRGGFFVVGLGLVLLWLISFWLFENVDSWQMVINSVTSIVTFLLVALLQNAQRRSERAINHKLNALAEGIADLMRKITGQDQNLADDIRQLKQTVGLEDRVSAHPPSPSAGRQHSPTGDDAQKRSSG